MSPRGFVKSKADGLQQPTLQFGTVNGRAVCDRYRYLIVIRYYTSTVYRDGLTLATPGLHFGNGAGGVQSEAPGGLIMDIIGNGRSALDALSPGGPRWPALLFPPYPLTAVASACRTAAEGVRRY